MRESAAKDLHAMSAQAVALARHALGLDWRTNGSSFRNQYCCALDTPEHEIWKELAARGLACVDRRFKIHGGEMFRLTYRGALAVLRPGERLDPEDFPEMRQ
ncbi:MAG: hypothetical protein J0H79_14065 [Alphaproteobacteria bacterium]|nr:hypothetical protein [Alphaproteobacteria bacterium]